MGGLTDERPKCLVELGGQPLLDWQVGALRAAGVTEIAIVVGWRKEQLAGRGAMLFENPRWAQTNMVASLACASAWLEKHPCVVSYSDIFYAPSAIKALLTASANIAITFDPDWLTLWSRRFTDPLSDAETFAVDTKGHLVEIGRRSTNLAEIGGQYMGLLKFTPPGWNDVSSLLSELSLADCDRLDMTTLLQRLIERGSRISAVPINGKWGEVDSASDLALYQRDIDNGLLVPPRLIGAR